MKRPNAREYAISTLPPCLAATTYEELVLETSRRLGRLKQPGASELLKYYATYSLDRLEFSNSIEINFVCDTARQLIPALAPFLSQCFVLVAPATDINAAALLKTDEYEGHIIRLNAGLVNWFTFFVAPFVTATWFLDHATPQPDRNEYNALYAKQMRDLSYLAEHNTRHSDVNKLSLPSFPVHEMWLEYTYYKQAALVFVTLHEIGHHVLEHTRQEHSELFGADLSAYVAKVRNDNHRLEFEADYFAVRGVMTWAQLLTRTAEDKVSVETNAWQIGSLLAFLGLARLSSDAEADSATHPSLVDRLQACIRFYLVSSCDYGQETGMFMTRAYSALLFGESSRITACWDEWWHNQLGGTEAPISGASGAA